MKKTITLFAALFITVASFAQAPEKMSYQAVIRDAGNTLVTNQAVGMQISVLQSTTAGTAVYVETQTPTTNTNGLVSIEIGGGTPVTGTFAGIDWSAGPYYIKTETDPAGGTNYTITGTSQLMSVPYALHAKTAETVTGEFLPPRMTNEERNLLNNPTAGLIIYNTSTAIPNYFDGATWRTFDGLVANYSIRVGQFYQGGIVVHLLNEFDFGYDPSVPHGLIAAPNDQTGIWGCRYTNIVGTETFYGSGASNTSKIIAGCPDAGIAAKLCDDLVVDIYDDWYLPSIAELEKIYLAKNFININPNFWFYWSSSQNNSDTAWHLDFRTGDQQAFWHKNSSGVGGVRAVRSF